MIIDTFTEKEILKELISDYTTEIKVSMKKCAKKYLDNHKSFCLFNYQPITLIKKVRTKSNNIWCYTIDIDRRNKAPWYGSACCITESKKGTKDYYVLRGLNDNPYFVQMSTHVAKRMLQRNIFGIDDIDCMPCLTFQKHETAVCVNNADFDYLKILSKIDNIENDHTIQKMIFTLFGAYFGYVSKEGNVYLKTYINPQMSVSGIKKESDGSDVLDKEAMLSYFGSTLHIYYNKQLYDEESLKFLYKSFPEGEEIDISKAKNFLLLKP